ncbi:MAG TPA: hypothetical protein PKJ99_02435 [Thermoanaerobaculales bacterium]|nr:hypothetical protein [Thermoanaerobaculales bacterium]
MSDNEVIEKLIEPIGSRTPPRLLVIRDALNHQLAPVGSDERRAVRQLADTVWALRMEPNPDRRAELHVEMLGQVDSVRKMQRQREEARRARGEE